MTPEKLARIREIYEVALAIDATARAAFLERECEGNREIRDEVDRLLAARERVPEWLHKPALALPSMEGRRLGGYTLIREIGRGGMGSVWLGERSDGAFHKQVAVKLVQPGAGRDGAEIVARFKHERDILASLDHPNIARLIDGGATEEGLPYFVMEFVDGQPIHRWCNERKLGISERIELFRDVCAAVRFAHQHLVVHRDLKPGNILVTADGTVKLLDFGIAKVLAGNVSPELAPTLSLAVAMTPEYASPEQVNGRMVTTHTDIYSLGVVLYELLTAHRPYRLASAALHEMARVICEVEPARPSGVVENPLRKRLEGDLDCIVLTALRKDPARRYGSVEAFSEDLQRHLDHRPVSAREDTLWYRARRFVERNPGGVMAALFIVILLVASMLTMTWMVRLSVAAAPAAFPFQPVWALFGAFLLVGFAAAIYFTRPGQLRLAGALAGGVSWATAMALKYWLNYSLGWWRSRFPLTSDPMKFLSVPVWFACVLGGAIALLILWRLGRRFGWKGQAIFIVALSFYQEIRERVWWATILPAMTSEWGLTPILTGVAIYITGLTLGLLIMRRIAGRD